MEKSKASRYQVSGITYRLQGVTVVIEHADGLVELYRRCATKNEAQAKLEALVIKAGSEAMFEYANDEQLAMSPV